MAEQLIIFDTTLRDGEQSPGASMTREEKMRIAKQLERLKVDVIEAGFPASSNGDFEAVRAIANAIKDSTVCGLARANESDVRRAGDAQLLVLGHRRAGALLAVAHGGVEYDQVLFHGDAPSQIGAMRPEVTSPHLPGAANRVLPNWDWSI